MGLSVGHAVGADVGCVDHLAIVTVRLAVTLPYDQPSPIFGEHM